MLVHRFVNCRTCGRLTVAVGVRLLDRMDELPHQIRLPSEIPRVEPLPPSIDVIRARRETPGCETVLHLNNAGASLMPDCVVEAVANHLRLEAEIGGYEAAERAERPLSRAYDAIAGLIGAERDEIALTENGTRAWDMLFYAQPFAPGDRILTGVSEYGSNYLAFLQVARRAGVQIEVIPNDESGQLSIAALEAAIDDRVKLISLTHVPTNGGLVNPAAAVGRVARAAGIPYLLDAVQSVGQMPIDVRAIGCDMLTATGRKFLRGPRGTGFLYVRRELAERLEPPFIDQGSAMWLAPEEYQLRAGAGRFESWEGNIAGRIGLCVAVEYARTWGLDLIAARVRGLAGRLRAMLGELRGVTVRDLGQDRCAIVTFTVDGADLDDVREQLREQGINISVSRAHQTRLDMDARGFTALLRASVHYYNTDAELARFCAAIANLA